ncbi:MAG: hypothetical protein LKE96_06965 [Acetobacter peroxydans]|nr:hypothetical protein [Acetobacter peroxydans]
MSVYTSRSVMLLSGQKSRPTSHRVFCFWRPGLLGVDATPMEGFDAAALSEEFDLKRQGLTPVVLVSLGYHADGDFNAKLPKSRLQADVLFSRA